MARIRDYAVEQSPLGYIPDTKASPNDFGAQIGGALGGLGDTLNGVATRIAEHEDRKDSVRAQLLTAKAAEALTKQTTTMKTTAAPGGAGFGDGVSKAVEDTQAALLANESPSVKAKAAVALAQQRTHFMGDAAHFEATQGARSVRDDAQETLKTLQNTTTLNPATYEDNIAKSQVLIDSLAAGANTPGLNVDMRKEMQRGFTEQLTKDYFQGRLDSAKSAKDVTAIMTEMADPKFTERMDPKNTQQLINHSRSITHTIGAQNLAAGHAAVGSLKSRMDSNDKIDPNEITLAENTVNNAANPALTNEWLKLKTRHEATVQASQMPSAAVRESLARENGLPSKDGTPNYPGLPSELNAAAGLGSRASNGQISADFIARTFVRESGNDIAKMKRGKEEFAPKAAGDNVDIGSMRPAVRDAAAVAGEIFGAPLTINSGYRSQAKQDAIRGGRDTPSVAKHSNHTEGSAIDISTAGMGGEQKGKLVDALVQAGFTGFGEYDGHIHADMRGTVPGSYDAKRSFGGWTSLSPEVVATLEKRGFSSGKDASQVNRLGADGTQFKTAKPNYDFGSGNHPDGSPLSSARGPLQMLEGTWREYLPDAAKKFGIDIAGKSDAELLAMRSDPKIATLVFTDYMMKNKKTMEAGLGRQVNEGELYMGHLMGATGSTAFLKAVSQQPDAKTTDVLSAAAVNANKSVFLNKDGSAKTVQQTYYEISSNFNNGIDQLAHERAKALHSVAEKQAGLSAPHGDAVTYAAQSRRDFVPADIRTSEGRGARGEQSLQLEQFYELPHAKPLTTSEVSDYKKRIDDGDVATAVQALKEINDFHGRAAEGAAKQLGEQSAITSHLAGLFSKGGADAAVAEDIIAGRRRLKDDKSSKDWLGSAENGGTGRKFDAYVGNALDGVDPAARGAAHEAANAYYVQKFPSHDGVLNDANYRKAIDATMGGRLGVVNGKKTVLPVGVAAEEMDKAVDNITQLDLASKSATGDLPVDRLNRPLLPHQISTEGEFVHIGGTQYTIKLGDGKFAVTGNPDANGRPLLYRMTLDAKGVKEMASRGAKGSGDSFGGFGAYRP